MNFLMRNLMLALVLIAFAGTGLAATTTSVANPSKPKGKRSTSLNFEDDNVESLKNGGRDSLDTNRDKFKADDAVLYMKKRDYKAEIKKSLEELRYNP